ncbi:hypothetical protein JTB14_003286 [Gonioctena quinquepunctata]|nr:hypothetical protein JTB14_003286 [Gonioctena quinquepunctata]
MDGQESWNRYENMNGGAKDGLDMNLAPAWQKGYTGKGVVVSILDDGIQTNHPDLAQNYDPQASTDINGNDDDPMPQDNGDNKHGTRCAGEVAAVAYNQFCGVGVAYNASIGGVRMLDGVVNDAVEARALGLNPEHIDIYSASWGPEEMEKQLMVPVHWPGEHLFTVHTDSCNCDGYTNSIFTLSISSATQGGYKPWYLEECSSTLATTYSSGTPGHDKSVATVDMDARLRPDHICTVEHTGTSASAPLAAGICALALEANPTLTWRDMQYLVVLTSRPAPLEKESGWILNGVRRKVSHKFGYGLMDAGALVTLAEKWTTVPPQHICKSQEILEEKQINAAYGTTLDFFMDVDACGGTLNDVRFLEHVQCKISLRFFPRGNLRILLTSPMGTTSALLFERPRDVVSSNFDDWPFLSVHFWGEKAEGRWHLQVVNGGNRHVNQPGILKKWQLIFYGTSVNPVRLRPTNGARSTPWRSPLNTFTFPTQSQPVTENFFEADNIFRNFQDFPNIYAFSGSAPEPAISSLDGKKTEVRDNEKYSIEKDVETKDSCDDQCDEQGCFGKGTTKCIACRNKRMDKTCVPDCPPRSYSDSQNICQPCHEACETCTGPDQKSCVTCSPGHVRVIDLDICLQQCPEGYYENFADKTCIPCQPNCVGCQDRPDRCTSCDHHLLLYQSKCLAFCTPNTYETEDNSCASCHETCETCSGSNSSQCISCPYGTFWHEGRCIKECPGHHFAEVQQRECIECPPGCSECNKTTCISCLDDWKVNSKGRCVSQNSDRCDEDMYYDGGQCKPCHSTCGSCDGPTERACLSCASPFILQGTRCVGKCDKGFYNERDSQVWYLVYTLVPDVWQKPIAQSVKTAFSFKVGNAALLVPLVTTAIRDSVRGECRPGCPIGYYKTEYGCQKCHQSCRNCDGCEVQEDKRKINVEALLLSSQPVSTLQIVNPFNVVTGVVVIACLSVIILFVIIFIILQKNAFQAQQGRYNKVSIKKPKVTCNYNVVSVKEVEPNSISRQIQGFL